MQGVENSPETVENSPEGVENFVFCEVNAQFLNSYFKISHFTTEIIPDLFGFNSESLSLRGL